MEIRKFLKGAVEKLTGSGSEKNPDIREPGELMRKADTVGWELSAVVTLEFPDAEEREKERLEAEDALRRPIVGTKPMGRGVTSSKRVKFEDGTEGIYKPRARETEIRDGVRPGTFAMREWLASQIDRAAGFDIVPPTVLREGPEGMGSVQKMMPGKTPIDDLKLMGTWEKTAKPGALMRMSAFDRLVGQTDRKGDNFLVEEDGDLDAIDNSLIYSRSGFVNTGAKLTNLPRMLYQRRKGEVDAGERKRMLQGLERLRGSAVVLGKLKECFALALGSEDVDDAWTRFKGELDAMVRKGDV